MKKRIATSEEKERFRLFLIENGCPIDYVEKIIGDRPFVRETKKGLTFCSGTRKKKHQGFGNTNKHIILTNAD